MRKLMFIVFVAFAFLLLHSNITTAYENEIRSLSNAMAENIAKAGKKRIAVVDFTDLQGNITELGRFIAEEMSVDFTMTAKGFEVIDRNHLNRILAEHKLSLSGIVDQKTVQKLGQIAGVDAIVTGSITPLENSIRVVCKVIATDTARVISAAKGDIAKTKAIEELLGRGIEGGTIPGSTITSPPAKPKVLAKAEVRVSDFFDDHDFTLEARECKITRQQVNCTIAVVNNTPKTKGFRLYELSESILVDDFGNQHQPSKGGFPSGSYYNDTKKIPPNLPINFHLIYNDIPTTTKYVTVVVQIHFVDIHRAGKAVLRNIPLSK